MKIEGRRRTKEVIDLRTNDPPSSKHVSSVLTAITTPKPLVKNDNPLSRQVEGFFKIPRLSDKEQWDKNMSIIDEVYTSTHARGPRTRIRHDRDTQSQKFKSRKI